MKTNLLILFTLLTVISCKEDSPIDSFTQTSPADKEEVNPCCLTFEWEAEGSVQFSIAADENFTQAVITENVAENYYTVDQTFEPNQEYYWKIEQGEQVETSSFSIVNMLPSVDGIHQVSVEREDWTLNEETNYHPPYIDSITFIQEGQDIRLQYEGFDEVLSHIPHQFEENYVTYMYVSGSAFQGFLHLNYTNDSILVDIENGGLGGGTRRHMKGVR